MQALPRVTRSPKGVEAMRPWCVLLLVAFALFAPLAGAYGTANGASNPVSMNAYMGAGGCSMSLAGVSSSAMEDCCCAAPVTSSAPIQVAPTATKSCCTEPANEAPVQVPQLVNRCNCESSPLAPHSPVPGARINATVPAPDPSSTLVELMLAASYRPGSPLLWANLPVSGPIPDSLAPTRMVESCTSGANRIGILRGQATRLALLATLRR
ncbi:MAG: hypothetical protein ACI8Q9_000201 [Planctomycetota bacterium]|jgi:hypothetical protein